MTARTGTGSSGVRSPEMVRHQRRRELPGVELRTVFDSSRHYWFYSSGFDFLVPSTWRGEVCHQGRREVLEPGAVLAAHPGDMFASRRVLETGSWDLLTIDPSALAALGGDRAAWERGRLRPFSRVSPRLGTLFQAVAESLQSDLLECVQANLRSLVAAIAGELVAGELVDADATRPPQPPAASRPTPPAPPSASPRG
jgi:hypothetical protein